MSIVDLVVHKTHVPLSGTISWTLYVFPCRLLHVKHFLSHSNGILILVCWQYHLPLQEKIESSTDILKAILKPVVHVEEEISWPPRDPEALKLMEKVNICSASFYIDIFCSLQNFQWSF